MTTPYRITSISEASGLDDAGRLVIQKVVTYQTAVGDTGTVRLSKDVYTASTAREMIEDEIRENDLLREMK